MRQIIVYRYVLTNNWAGKYIRRGICASPAREFKWMKYKLFSWDKNFPFRCTWRLDGRSVRYIPGLHITENKPEEAEPWKR